MAAIKDAIAVLRFSAFNLDHNLRLLIKNSMSAIINITGSSNLKLGTFDIFTS